MANKEHLVYAIDRDSIKWEDEDFLKWCDEHGQTEWALELWADKLAELFENVDGKFDCLWEVMEELGYKGADENGEDW